MKKKNQSRNSDCSLAHVLYQKLGNDWYAFTEVDGDCFMTKVEEDEINDAARKLATGEEDDRRHSRTKRRAA